MDDIAITRRSGAWVLGIARPDRANALRHVTLRELAEALREIEGRAADTRPPPPPTTTTTTTPSGTEAPEETAERRKAGPDVHRTAASGTEAPEETAERVAADGSLRGVVVTGRGGRFSAGADLGELTGDAGDIGFDEGLASLTAAIASFPLPIVAAVEGPCVGAGVDLAWSCDAVVVSPAARIWIPAARLGILYNPEALARLHARMGPMALRRLALLGEELSGADLAAAGAAVPAGDGGAVETAVRLLDRAAGASDAAAATKALLASLDDGSFDASAWQEQRRALASSPDRRRRLLDHKDSIKGLA